MNFMELINKAAGNYNAFAETPIPLPLTKDTTLADLDSVFDSLSLTTFIMEIELVTDMNLMTGDAIDHMNTMGELASYLERVVNASL